MAELPPAPDRRQAGPKPSLHRTLDVVYPARTALAALASLLAARLCRMPEPYWAPITTVVITQPSLGAALTVSRQRFIGTILGAAVGTIVALLLHQQYELWLSIL